MTSIAEWFMHPSVAGEYAIISVTFWSYAFFYFGVMKPTQTRLFLESEHYHVFACKKYLCSCTEYLPFFNSVNTEYLFPRIFILL